MKAEEKERDDKRDLEAAKEKERSKEKYMEKSIQELDLSECERCTPSYRLLPSDVIKKIQSTILHPRRFNRTDYHIFFAVSNTFCAPQTEISSCCSK